LIAKLFSSKLSQSTAFALCFSGLNCNGLNYNGLKGKMQGLSFFQDSVRHFRPAMVRYRGL
ncbi:MAG: hypothetical protein II572_00960, partial [Clostridia bacterium]|nr:hypothetical protein [Clostridia bacterium]